MPPPETYKSKIGSHSTMFLNETEKTKQPQIPNKFIFDDIDVGSLLLASVHAVVSHGWVQPSQPIPTTTLSSSLS